MAIYRRQKAEWELRANRITYWLIVTAITSLLWPGGLLAESADGVPVETEVRAEMEERADPVEKEETGAMAVTAAQGAEVMCRKFPNTARTGRRSIVPTSKSHSCRWSALRRPPCCNRRIRV